MIEAVVILAVAAIAWTLFAPAKEAPPAVVEHHHHYRLTVIERPAPVQAQIYLIKMEIALAESKREPAPPPLPEARLLNPKTAIERYRSPERSLPWKAGRSSS